MKTKTSSQSIGAGTDNLQSSTTATEAQSTLAWLAASESFVAHLKRRHPRISRRPGRDGSFRRLCRIRAQGYSHADAFSSRSQAIADACAWKWPGLAGVATLTSALVLGTTACQVLTYSSPNGERFTRSSIGNKTSVAHLSVTSTTNGMHKVDLKGYQDDSTEALGVITDAAIKAAISAAKP